MANSLNTNPIYLDTFTSDVTVVDGRVQIYAVYFETDADNDVLVLKDKDGNVIWRQTATAETVDGGTTYDQPNGNMVVFTHPIMANGLILDVSAGNYDGNCYVLIYV